MEEERIKELIQVPEWKSLLLELVEKNEIDPWNVDIVKLTSLYIEEIRKRKSLDLYIPANAVLASSILLYLKSKVLEELRKNLEEDKNGGEEIEPFFEEPEEVVTIVDYSEAVIPAEESEDMDNVVVVPPHRIVKRNLTLDELLDTMEKLMKRVPKRSARQPLLEVEEFFEAMEEGEDVEDFIEEVYKKIKEVSDSTGMVLLSQIAGEDPLTFVKTLLATLYLANQGRVELYQEKVFEDVIIKVIE